MTIILASKSPTRAKILQDAGVDIICIPSNLNEDNIKQNSEDSPKNIAMMLAKEKAKIVSLLNFDSYVIGADQIMDFEGQLLSKSKTQKNSREKLCKLRGKWHSLWSAICIYQKGVCLFEYNAESKLHMRSFSDQFLSHYIENLEENTLQTVGCYQLERQGIQLFDKIEGDYFDILGFPLLPILNFLREKNYLVR